MPRVGLSQVLRFLSKCLNANPDDGLKCIFACGIFYKACLETHLPEICAATLKNAVLHILGYGPTLYKELRTGGNGLARAAA